MDTPQWLLDRLPVVAAVRREIAEARQRAAEMQQLAADMAK